MAVPNELFNFSIKFLNLWHSGKNAQLFAECHDGHASINLRLHLGQHPAAPQEHQHHPPKSKPSPSRLRRRAKRAHDRTVAAANAASNAPTIRAQDAVLPQVPTSTTKDAAVQVADNATQTAEVSVKAAVTSPMTKEIAVQAEPPGYAGQVCLDSPLDEQFVRSDQLSRHLLPVADVFCPDRDYFEESRAARAHEIQKDRDKRERERQEDTENFKILLQSNFKP